MAPLFKHKSRAAKANPVFALDDAKSCTLLKPLIASDIDILPVLSPVASNGTVALS